MEGYEQFSDLIKSMFNVYHVELTNCKLTSEPNYVIDFHLFLAKFKSYKSYNIEFNFRLIQSTKSKQSAV